MLRRGTGMDPTALGDMEKYYCCDYGKLSLSKLLVHERLFGAALGCIEV